MIMEEDLAAIYGDDVTAIGEQKARYEEAYRRFVTQFGPGKVTFFRTPGRVNLIGEHTDYNGGFVMPVALDKDALLVARPRSDALINVVNVEAQFAPFTFVLEAHIPPAPSGDWSNYFRGAGQEISRQFGGRAAIKGMDVLVSGTPPHGVPHGAGLSSSTALTVAAAFALVTLNGIDVAKDALAHLCSEAEWYVGTRGGMMDQFAALLSQRDHALFLDCRPSPEGIYRFEHVPMPDNVQIVLLTSGVHHDNVRGEFNQRVAECKIGVRLLQKQYPAIKQLRDVAAGSLGLPENELWRTLEQAWPVTATSTQLAQNGVDEAWLNALVDDHRLDAAATFAVRARCTHVIRENERVLASVAALKNGDIERFGELINAAHVSMSRDFGASCPQVDTLVEIVRRQPGVLGARITGAGWGGGVVALVRRDTGVDSASRTKNHTAWIPAVQKAYKSATSLDTHILICHPGRGASFLAVDSASEKRS